VCVLRDMARKIKENKNMVPSALLREEDDNSEDDNQRNRVENNRVFLNSCITIFPAFDSIYIF